jgi:peptide-methionine (R)-S-oxide reductase
MEIKLAALIGGAIILTAGAFAVVNFGGAAAGRGEATQLTLAGTAAHSDPAIPLLKAEEFPLEESMKDEVKDQAKEKLTPEQYNVCVMGGTEQPFNNKYYNHHEDGTYSCIVCGEPLFASETKYQSGSGWPAFFDAIDKGKILEVEDTSHGMVRTEVRCASCGAHLGHLFPDGPQPTGMRYCINSASLDFSGAGEEPDGAESAEQGESDESGAAGEE